MFFFSISAHDITSEYQSFEIGSKLDGKGGRSL